MEISRNVFAFISPVFSLDHLIRWTGRKEIFPFYHAVTDKKRPHLAHVSNPRTPKQFVTELDFLLQHFKAEKVKDVGTKEDPSMHISFDDGLKESIDVIAPILLKKGIPATFFINPAFIDNQDMFYRYKVSLIIDKMMKDIKLQQQVLSIEGTSKSKFLQKLHSFSYHDQTAIERLLSLFEIDVKTYLREEKPYLSSEDVMWLRSKGFTIGAHSMDHPFFKDIEEVAQKKQIGESIRQLNEKYGIEKYYFSFPFSDEAVSSSTMSWMYKNANIINSFGISGIKDDFDQRHIHRIPMEHYDIPTDKILKSEYLYFIAKGIFGKNKIQRS